MEQVQQRAITKIVDTKLGTDGCLYYEVTWSSSWVKEDTLTSYPELVEMFWSFIKKNASLYTVNTKKADNSTTGKVSESATTLGTNSQLASVDNELNPVTIEPSQEMNGVYAGRDDALQNELSQQDSEVTITVDIKKEVTEESEWQIESSDNALDQLGFYQPSMIANQNSGPNIETPTYSFDSGSYQFENVEATNSAPTNSNSLQMQLEKLNNIHEEPTLDEIRVSFTDVVTDTGEMRVRCLICNKILSESSSRRRHYLAHSSVKRFSCPYCPKKSKHKTSIDRHVKLLHKREYGVIGQYPSMI